MIVVLDWKTLKPSLVNMSLSRGPVVSMIALSMRQRHPAQKVTHATILSGLQHKVPMIGHQLIAENTTWVTLQPFGKDSLECVVIRILLENSAAGIATVQGMVKAIGFIGAFRSRHANIVSEVALQINDS